VSRSRSKRGQRSNRSAKILTTIFSIVVVLSFVLSLLGPSVFRSSDEPTPSPTYVFPTVAPRGSPTPSASPTPTAGIPTPVVVTPRTSP
jgi:cytoskeletal protein RodZ